MLGAGEILGRAVLGHAGDLEVSLRLGPLERRRIGTHVDERAALPDLIADRGVHPGDDSRDL